MSFAAKNIVAGSPQLLSLVAENYRTNSIGFTELVFESSPIYTTLDLEWGISGSYSDATYDYDYSYTSSFPQKTRESLNTNVVTVDFPGITGAFAGLDVLSADFAGSAVASTDKFSLALLPSLYFDYFPDLYPFFSPLYQAFKFYGGSHFESGVVVGTRTKQSDMTTSDITTNVSVAAPFFGVTYGIGRVIVESLGFSATNISETEDLTAYSAADWRDFRGAYEYNHTNGNGITTTAKWIIG